MHICYEVAIGPAVCSYSVEVNINGGLRLSSGLGLGKTLLPVGTMRDQRLPA